MLKRLAKDDDLTIDEDVMEKAIEFLSSRLKPEELSHLKMLLKGEGAEAEDGEVDRTPTDSGPASFRGMPKPGGSMASNSIGTSYADRWPSAARIGWAY